MTTLGDTPSTTEFPASQPFAAPLTRGAVALSALLVANRVQCTLLPGVAGAYRYLQFGVGTSSGNIDVGVVRMSAAELGGNRSIQEVIAATGSIACPSAGRVRADLGAFELTPGVPYAVAVWADNTSATVTMVDSSLEPNLSLRAGSGTFTSIANVGSQTLVTYSKGPWFLLERDPA